MKDEARKKLADAVQGVGELIPRIFSPRGIQNPDAVDKRLTDLKATLGKIKSRSQP